MSERLAHHLARMNSPVPAERDESHKFLSELFETAPFEFAAQSSSLVMRDDVPRPVVHAALVCIGRCLSGGSETQIAQIRGTFRNPANQESRELIKQAVVRGIMFETPAIRMAAAHCVDLVLRIEQSEWMGVFDALNTVAASDSYEDCAHQGAVCAFREVLKSNHVPVDAIADQVRTLFSLIDRVLASPDRYSPEMHKECCLSFPVLLKRTVSRHDVEQVARDLHLIEVNIRHDDFDVFKAMLASIAKIFKGRYCEMTQELLETIFRLSVAGFESNLGSYQVATLVLWSGMAKHEGRIEKQYEDHRNGGDAPVPRYVISKCVDMLFPILCEFMGLMSADMDLTDIDYSDPPFVAVECLSNVYSAATGAVVEKIEERWRTRSDQIDASHAASVLSLVAMLTSDAKDKPETTHFLAMHISDVFAYCESSTSLAYFCFNIMAKAISRYNIGREYVTNGKLLECLMATAGRSTAIIGKSLSTVKALCKISQKDDEESPLARLFGQIVDFLGALMKHRSHELKSRAIESLACVVSFLPSSKCSNEQDGFCNFVLTTVEAGISEIRDSGNIDNPAVFSVLVSYCDVLSAICNRLGVGVAPLSDRIMGLVVNLLHAQRSLYEETTIVMSAMILALREQFSRYYTTLRAPLETMLKSGNKQVAISALSVLCDMFTVMPRGIASDVQPIVEILFTLIDSPMTDWQLMVKVIGTVSEAISVWESESVDLFLSKLFAATGRILMNVSAVVHSPERLTAVRESFAVLLTGLGTIVKRSTDEKFLASNLNNFFSAINKFVESGCFYRETLLPFFELLEEMAHKYGSKISIKLNHRKIRATLVKAKSMNDPFVAGRAAKVLDFLSHYK